MLYHVSTCSVYQINKSVGCGYSLRAHHGSHFTSFNVFLNIDEAIRRERVRDDWRLY